MIGTHSVRKSPTPHGVILYSPPSPSQPHGELEELRQHVQDADRSYNGANCEEEVELFKPTWGGEV
jgi:hypothetical protein